MYICPIYVCEISIYIYGEYIYVVNIYLLSALRRIRTVLRTRYVRHCTPSTLHTGWGHKWGGDINWGGDNSKGNVIDI